MKNIRIFFSENFQFLVIKFSVCLNRHVFVMENSATGDMFIVNAKINLHISAV